MDGAPEFDPNPRPGTAYASPTAAQCSMVSRADNRAIAIQNAFALTLNFSSPVVKDELCHLKNIILRNAGRSWGFYENPKNAKIPTDLSYPGSFIGILEGDLSHTLKNEEDDLLYPILRNTNNPQSLMEHTVTDGSGANLDNSNSTKLGVLAVLAHELGHIKWHRDNIPLSLWCFQDSFVNKSWLQDNSLGQAYRKTWTDFNDRAGNHRHNTPHPHDNNLNQQRIRSIYDNGSTDGFVSAFAAVSPEEDFVETYKLVVLRSVTDFGFLITLKFANLGGVAPPPPQDVNVRENTNVVVIGKRACVEKLFPPSH